MFLWGIFFKVLQGILSLILSRLRTPIHSVASDSFNVTPFSDFVQLSTLFCGECLLTQDIRCYTATMGDEELGAA